jgi:FAD/FMN-containing dehydrogenase
LLDEVTVKTLDRVFSRELISPHHPGHDDARKVWNGMVDRRPALIARCANDGDVVEAVRFAREAGLRLAVRGGGHNVAGNAVCDDGLVIDLSGMKGIQVDSAAHTARAQPGVVLGEFDRATQEVGLAAPTGNVSRTGLAGLLVSPTGVIERVRGLRGGSGRIRQQ